MILNHVRKESIYYTQNNHITAQRVKYMYNHNVHVHCMYMYVLFSLCLTLTALAERQATLQVREGEREREGRRREEDSRHIVVTQATQKQYVYVHTLYMYMYFSCTCMYICLLILYFKLCSIIDMHTITCNIYILLHTTLYHRALVELSQQLSSEADTVNHQKKSSDFLAKKSTQYQKLISSLKVCIESYTCIHVQACIYMYITYYNNNIIVDGHTVPVCGYLPGLEASIATYIYCTHNN